MPPDISAAREKQRNAIKEHAEFLLACQNEHRDHRDVQLAAAYLALLACESDGEDARRYRAIRNCEVVVEPGPTGCGWLVKPNDVDSIPEFVKLPVRVSDIEDIYSPRHIAVDANGDELFRAKTHTLAAALVGMMNERTEMQAMVERLKELNTALHDDDIVALHTANDKLLEAARAALAYIKRVTATGVHVRDDHSQNCKACQLEKRLTAAIGDGK